MPRHKTGGRQKGTPNRKTAELRERVAKTGMMPLDVILKHMRWHERKADAAVRRKDDAEAERHMKEADDAANRAAPYLHAKLSAVEVGGSGGQPLVVNITGKAALL